MLRRVVGSLLEKQQLEYFSGIAHTSGFLDLVSNLISELKRDEVWPEDFERVARVVAGAALETEGPKQKSRSARSRDSGRPRDRELATIYRTYQDLLLAKNLYDGEGRFWSVREALDVLFRRLGRESRLARAELLPPVLAGPDGQADPQAQPPRILAPVTYGRVLKPRHDIGEAL